MSHNEHERQITRQRYLRLQGLGAPHASTTHHTTDFPGATSYSGRTVSKAELCNLLGLGERRVEMLTAEGMPLERRGRHPHYLIPEAVQ